MAIETHFTDQYKGNLKHLLQNAGGAYRPLMTETRCAGEQSVVVNQFGSVEMTEVTERFASMGRTEPTRQRVWLEPKIYDLPLPVDRFDQLKTEMIDIKSNLTEAGVKAVMRKIDDIARDAFFADILVGQKGASTESFDTTNHRVDAAIGAGADTGLNVEKIIRAKRILKENENYMKGDKVCLAIHPKQEEDLLNQTKVISTDYFESNGRPVFNSDGELQQFLGVNIVCTTKVPSNSSYRLNPMWVQSGMAMGLWQDMEVKVHERPDLQGIPWQVYLTIMMNVTRTEAGRVVQIESTEA